MKRIVMSSFLFLFLSANVFAGNSVKLKVTLSPVGDFTAKSETLQGGLTIGADHSFMAHNIQLDLNTLKTGVTLRDEHMKEKYFEVSKGADYRYAVLEDAAGQGGKFKGKLRVHAKVAPIEGTYSVQGSVVNAKFNAKISDFGIKEANYKGVGVEDSVGVEVAMLGSVSTSKRVPSSEETSTRQPADKKVKKKKKHR